MTRPQFKRGLAYFVAGVAFYGTAMWLSDYQYDWALLMAGVAFGTATAPLLEATE